jgi:DNA-binding helix-hairpin-helix protein with protein kinase domain
MPVVALYQDDDVRMPRLLDVGDPVYSGGEGSIFFSSDGTYAVKIYHPGVAAEKRQFLEMITLLGRSLTPEESQFLCWPLAMVRSVDNVPQVGCVTRRIPASYKSLCNFNENPKTAKAQFLAGRSWSHYLQIARGVARAVAVLHGRGCAHTDLSNFNFLVNPDTADVVLLDLDGLVVPGFLPAQVKGTRGIIAREIMLRKSKPNELSDRHSLAVQILQTLLFRNVFQSLTTYDTSDPDEDEEIGWGQELTFSEEATDRRNRPRLLGVPLFQGGALSYRMLTPTLQKRTEQACVEGKDSPSRRPSAREWITALGYALDELYQCSSCRMHSPHPYWLKPAQRRVCPFCGNRVAGNLPSVLSIYEPRSRGKYVFTERHLVMGHGWQLFSDILDPQRDPPMSRKKEPSVGRVELDNKHGLNTLVNDEGVTWRVQLKGQSIKSVGRGDSFPLTPGAVVNFGEARRLLVVEE